MISRKMHNQWRRSLQHSCSKIVCPFISQLKTNERKRWKRRERKKCFTWFQRKSKIRRVLLCWARTSARSCTSLSDIELFRISKCCKDVLSIRDSAIATTPKMMFSVDNSMELRNKCTKSQLVPFQGKKFDMLIALQKFGDRRSRGSRQTISS